VRGRTRWCCGSGATVCFKWRRERSISINNDTDVVLHLLQLHCRLIKPNLNTWNPTEFITPLSIYGFAWVDATICLLICLNFWLA
jgi:hypothetical protein